MDNSVYDQQKREEQQKNDCPLTDYKDDPIIQLETRILEDHFQRTSVSNIKDGCYIPQSRWRIDRPNRDWDSDFIQCDSRSGLEKNPPNSLRNNNQGNPAPTSQLLVANGQLETQKVELKFEVGDIEFH